MKLIMWSGGVDSTVMLYQALQVHDVVRTHHIDFINPSRLRARLEKKAVSEMREWFAEKFPTKSIIHTRTVVDFSNIAVTHAISDLNTVYFISAQLATIYHDVDGIQIGVYNEEWDMPVAQERFRNAQQLLKLCLYKERHVELELPLVTWNKYDIHRAIPEDLRVLTWSCRTPLRKGDLYYVPCRNCETCKKIIQSHYGKE